MIDLLSIFGKVQSLYGRAKVKLNVGRVELYTDNVKTAFYVVESKELHILQMPSNLSRRTSNMIKRHILEFSKQAKQGLLKNYFVNWCTMSKTEAKEVLSELEAEHQTEPKPRKKYEVVDGKTEIVEVTAPKTPKAIFARLKNKFFGGLVSSYSNLYAMFKHHLPKPMLFKLLALAQ